MNVKNNQRVRLTKRLFGESLIKLLKNYSLHEITITQLCAEAEMNRSTFYKYYTSVRGLYEQVEKEALERSAQCVRGMELSSEKAVVHRIEKLLDHFRENSDLYLLLLENSIDGEFPYKMIGQTVGFIADIPDIVPDGRKEYAEYCSIFVVSGALNIIRAWLRNGTNESPAVIAELIFRLAADALKFDLKRYRQFVTSK